MLMAALPVVADGLLAVVMLLTLPVLTARLEAPAGWNALLLVALYVLFCIGVYLLRKLEPQVEVGRWQPPDWLMRPQIRGVLAALFALLMMTTVSYQLGFFDAVLEVGVGDLQEGSSASLFVFGPGAWLGFSMLYILILAFPVQASVRPSSSRYTVLALLGLLLGNGMLLMAVAQARAMVLALGWDGSLFTMLLAFAALVVSFAPPRLVYQSRQPYLSGLVSLTLILLAGAWVVGA